MRQTLLAAALAAFALAPARAGMIEDRFTKAEELLDKARYAEARAALDELFGWLRPDDPQTIRYHERSGAAWLREGKVKEARTSFTEALRTAQRLKVADGATARAYTGMGACLRREKNDPYALKFFKKALALSPDEGTRMFAEDQVREIEGVPPLPAAGPPPPT